MSTVDKDGMLIDAKITLKRYTSIEHGNLSAVKAVVVHQTDAPTAQHTFNGYNAGGNGAHFLIAKNGDIYQTASELIKQHGEDAPFHAADLPPRTIPHRKLDLSPPEGRADTAVAPYSGGRIGPSR